VCVSVCVGIGLVCPDIGVVQNCVCVSVWVRASVCVCVCVRVCVTEKHTCSVYSATHIEIFCHKYTPEQERHVTHTNESCNTH